MLVALALIRAAPFDIHLVEKGHVAFINVVRGKNVENGEVQRIKK